MKIIEVTDNRAWKQFLQLPFRLFNDVGVWVPPLLSEQKHLLDKEKNPFFKHCYFKAWLVIENDLPVGRVIAFVDTLYNSINNSKTGFIGFFDSINNHDVAAQLFEESSKWLKENGMKVIFGPMNFSIGNECGLQLDAFDSSPFILMNYTPAYYKSLFENAGFAKEHDMYAYLMTADEVKRREPLLRRLEEMGNKALAKEGVRLRNMSMKKYEMELGNIQLLYNDCMRDNWGFVPVSFEEMLYNSRSLKQIADKYLVFFAEVNGEVVGCSVAVPDVNQSMQHVRDGKLFPTGFLKLLYYLKKTNRFRLIFIGVKRDHRFKGLDALFYYHTMRKGVDRGYRSAELSWISEGNENLIRIVEKIGAIRYKTYRVYKKELQLP